VSERTLVARTNFRKCNEFSIIFFIKGLLYCKRFECDQWKNVSACDRRKPDGCYPKNDFDRDFFVGALCMTFILKLNPLFIYSYVYVGSRTIFFPVYLACRSRQATIVLEKYYRFEVSLLSSYAYEGGRNHSSFGRSDIIT